MYHEDDIGKAILYNWLKRYCGMKSSYIKKLKALRDENLRLNQMYSDRSLDHRSSKKDVAPTQKMMAYKYDNDFSMLHAAIAAASLAVPIICYCGG